jgi:hypothetical protein
VAGRSVGEGRFEQVVVDRRPVGSSTISAVKVVQTSTGQGADGVGLIADEPTSQQRRGALRPPAVE